MAQCSDDFAPLAGPIMESVALCEEPICQPMSERHRPLLDVAASQWTRHAAWLPFLACPRWEPGTALPHARTVVVGMPLGAMDGGPGHRTPLPFASRALPPLPAACT